MKNFIHLAERPELSFGMRTENHNGKRNYVTPEGELYPSITTILSEFSKASIQAWRKRVGEMKQVMFAPYFGYDNIKTKHSQNNKVPSWYTDKIKDLKKSKRFPGNTL
jgi:hypothetical protein